MWCFMNCWEKFRTSRFKLKKVIEMPRKMYICVDYIKIKLYIIISNNKYI